MSNSAERERRLQRGFAEWQDRKYENDGAAQMLGLDVRVAFGPTSKRGTVLADGKVILGTDLGKVEWGDGDKLRGKSVHARRNGNRNGRH